MPGVHVTRGSAQRLAGEGKPGRPCQCPPARDDRRVPSTSALYAQALAARVQSALLAEQLQEATRRARENWQLIQDSWGRAEHIRAQRRASHDSPDRLRYSAHARLQARLASMPVIEQAKGIIMAQYGWTEEQAFDAIRRASQRENIKVRDLAITIVARATRPAPAQRRARPARVTAHPDAGGNPLVSPGGSRDPRQASA